MALFIRNIILYFLSYFRQPKPGIHIISSHYVTKQKSKHSDAVTFENFLKNLNKKCKLIDFESAIKSIESNIIPEDESIVAFTFDDGFEECATIIAPILEKYNCRAAFFINANYIESSEEYQSSFQHRVKTYTKKPMTWDQIISLHNNGHTIGSHSLDHFDFGKLTNEQIEFQLKRNKEILESRLDYDCKYFAWTYGLMKNFPLNALSVTSKYHQYIFSATNYKKYFSYAGKVINRRHIEPYWPYKHAKYFLQKKIFNKENN